MDIGDIKTSFIGGDFFYSLLYYSNILFKTLSALDNHLSHMHYQLLYVDTGLFKSLELLSKYFY